MLTIGLMVLGPMVSLGNLLNLIRTVEDSAIGPLKPEWGTFKLVAWSIVATAAALSVMTGYRLRADHRPESVKLAKKALWLIGPMSNALLNVSMIVVLQLNPTPEFIGSAIGGLAGGCIVAFIWTVYLSRSRRVRNTYLLDNDAMLTGG